MKILGRDADSAGLAHYRGAGEISGVQVALELLESEEFQEAQEFRELEDKHDGVHADGDLLGLKAAAFGEALADWPASMADVELLYTVLLERPLDAPARKSRASQLAAGPESLTAGTLAREVASSLEFAMDSVFWGVLRRAPDSESRRHYFAENLAKSQDWPLSFAQIAHEIIRSKEAAAVQRELYALPSGTVPSWVAARVKLMEPGATPIDAVRAHVYRKVLSRRAAQLADIEYLYVTILARRLRPDKDVDAHGDLVFSGASVLSVSDQLLDSAEFKQRLGEGKGIAPAATSRLSTGLGDWLHRSVLLRGLDHERSPGDEHGATALRVRKPLGQIFDVREMRRQVGVVEAEKQAAAFRKQAASDLIARWNDNDML